VQVQVLFPLRSLLSQSQIRLLISTLLNTQGISILCISPSFSLCVAFPFSFSVLWTLPAFVPQLPALTLQFRECAGICLSSPFLSQNSLKAISWDTVVLTWFTDHQGSVFSSANYFKYFAQFTGYFKKEGKLRSFNPSNYKQNCSSSYGSFIPHTELAWSLCSFPISHSKRKSMKDYMWVVFMIHVWKWLLTSTTFLSRHQSYGWTWFKGWWGIIVNL
jgi:hypothetical protein